MATRAIVFDLFDTLVDLHMENLPHGKFSGRPLTATAEDLHAEVQRRSGVSYESFARALVEVDAEFFESRYARGLELPTFERFTAVLHRLDLDAPGLAEELTDIHMGRLREQVRVPEHHAQLLAELSGRVRLAVCSNFSHSKTALAVLEDAKLLPHFDVVVISDAVGIRKPRREIFEVVLGELGVTPAEVLHVGDNLKADVAGASELGMRTAWVTRRVRDPEASRRKYAGPDPDLRISDLAELSALLDSDERASEVR